MAGSQLKMGLQLNGYRNCVNALRKFKEGYSDGSRWIVGVGAEYGAYVEFGTSRMASQPYLLPAARHVVRSEFPRLEAQAHKSSNPVKAIVRLLALEIEREAKDRAPVDTGNLQNSIEAAPADTFL